MALNRQKLAAALQQERKFTYLPFSLHLFETVSSTNQILWEELNSGAEPGCVVIATQQTCGRGQWGRQWMSPEGGLYLSVAIAPKLDATNSYQITLATAWGIARQLRNCGVPVGIKWPNDLVLISIPDIDTKTDLGTADVFNNYKKLGGILTETKVYNGLITQAVIGVGINWANPVPETGINLETWQANQHPKPISSLEMLTSTVLLGIESGIMTLFQEGVNILLSRYLELLTNIGDRVYVDNVAGTIVGVTPQGELRVLLSTSELKTVITPEIYLQPGTISLGYRKSSN
ncbi:MAG: biotin--[Stigonema ocellatum SAG 48.90 = DSM 106950]|nr:biotin--[acetyl-CoA-carboxylase] ligase [Stigonema ocellatum SAG 48.90 = DSM 106950]